MANKVAAIVAPVWLLGVVITHFSVTRKVSDSESAKPSCDIWGSEATHLGGSNSVVPLCDRSS